MTDDSDQEDLANVRAFLGGDDAGFEALFAKYRENVYGIAYRFVRDKEDALEIAQDVFLRVHRSLARFKTQSRFFTWLYRITVNRAIDVRRSRKKLPIVGVGAGEHDHHVPATPRSEPSPIEVAQEHELEEKLEKAVGQLSDKHRSVFLLHAVENLTYREIAETLECNIGTVMSRLFYARQHLKTLLAEFDVDAVDSEKSGS